MEFSHKGFLFNWSLNKILWRIYYKIKIFLKIEFFKNFIFYYKILTNLKIRIFKTKLKRKRIYCFYRENFRSEILTNQKILFNFRLSWSLIIIEQISKIYISENPSICHYGNWSLFNLNNSYLSKGAFFKGLRILSREKIKKFQIVNFCLKRNFVSFVGIYQFFFNLQNWQNHIEISLTR